MPKKILFFTYWYPYPKNNSFGIFIKRHAHALSISHDLVVLSFLIVKDQRFYKKEIHVFTDEKGIETHQIIISSRFNKLLYVLLPIHYLILKKYIKTDLANTFEIIHSNILFPASIVAYKLSLYFKVKFVITEHWSKLPKFFKQSIYKKTGKKALDSAAAITCVSTLLANTLKKYTENRNVFVVPNVIDSQKFYIDAAIKKNPVFTFIAVAHWTPPKNPYYFTEALQQFHKKNPGKNFKLVMVGTGPLLDKIRNSNYNYTIEYIDSLSQDELRKEYNKSHVFLHSSAFETFSVVIIEALMCGLPVIVSNVGVAPEIINSSNGYITSDNVSDWYDKINRIYFETYDNHIIAGQLRKSFSPEKAGTLFNEIYQSI